ncbi:MAG TPA: hypothetical protein VHM26_10645 [Chitinophagaceae bacterium]|nr:hypothetical protein [Chitinophagaceae bacterium]
MELINDQGVYKYIYKNKNESLPHHAWKILLVNSLNELYVEEDNFFNPGKNEWLIAQHNYKNHLTSYKYLDPQNSSKAIDGRVFDSVLTSWKIELYKEPVIIGNK